VSGERGPLTLPYQRLLRGIGAHLDEYCSRNVHLLEEPNGFTVRYQTEPGKNELIVARYSHDELLQRQAEMERHQARGSPAGAGSYQDFLRALGFELETRSAYSILVDELEDGFLVTYQYLKPEEGYVLRKAMIVAGPGEIGAILQHAHERRQRPKRRRFLS
jgi:hypothetical protein